ncbi:FGGY-family carbohydrate kinase [Candidatus Aquiluna sp. UB-MaderosW2red]|uniref:FGGY-family carbohydrate kinase n=1 Tax=Candidatus Aquiluna sp. UB-MaderosW2red TaxID=1855377 RepID=UPI000875D899|nr:FGGY family carbohydrate kinase [Candidatus Aquiluna sp. UB-MaderosW2red]SCX03520.1 xylulokinase [Candidatus Aquiluna sp. UB-MaderosW2red]
MTQFTIGIDIGTTGTKSILFEAGKGVVATANADTTLHSPQAGWAEADTAQWLSNVYSSVRELLETTGCDPRQVLGISTTGMVPAVVLIDETGSPLSRAVLQNDARAIVEIAAVAAELQSLDVVEETGSPLSQQSLAPTLRWFQQHEPDIWSRTKKVLGSYDWVLMALGAEVHVERNWALESGLFHIDGRIHEDILAAARIQPSLLPPVVSAGEVVGALSEESAEAMGLLPGTPLIVGGADHVLSAYSAGVSQEGDWLVKLGGAGDILVATNKPLVDKRLYLDAHPIEGTWLPNGCMATSGSLLRWFQELTQIEDLARMDDEAEACLPAEVLCLPYFLGEKSPLHDPDLRGVFFGMHLGTTRAEMYRSVLEAIAFGFRHHVEVLKERGIRFDRAMVTNGGSKSTLWKQIHADILGVEMHPVIDHPGASLGAAVIAGVGVGVLDSLASIRNYVRLGDAIHPNLNKTAIYNVAYAQWRELATVTTPVAHQLSERTRR